MAGIYDVLELSTAVKPWLLRHLLDDRGRAHRLPGPRHRGASTASRRSTSCSREPSPRPHTPPDRADAARRQEARARRTSSSPAPTTSASSGWSPERTPTCSSTGGPSGCGPTAASRPEQGLFVDQRWMDFVPGHRVRRSRSCATPATTSRTGTCNSRPLERSEGATVRAGAASLLPLQRATTRTVRGV